MSQIALNSIIAASVIALVAVGFSIIYGCARFFHLAHGAVFASGAYCYYVLAILWQLPLTIALPLAVVFSAALGLAMERCVYRRLRKQGASTTALLLASLGMYIVLQNVISIGFGDQTRTVRVMAEEGIGILGAKVTTAQILIIVTSITLILFLWVLSMKTRAGVIIRAVAIDPELAKALGIDCEKVILSSFALGSALAGLAGVLVAFDVDMTPGMGLNALLMGAVAAIVGGIGSIPGMAVGALLIGAAQHFGVWWIGSQWQDAIAFIILLAFLLVRPEGVMGKKLRKATA